MNQGLRILSYFRRDLPLVALALMFLLLSTGASLLKPWPLALVIDNLLGDQPLPAWLASRTAGWTRPHLLSALVLSTLVIHVSHALLSSAQVYLQIQVGLRGLARVRNQLFNWLQRLSLRFHQGSSQGDLIYRASWNTYAFQTLLQQGLFTLVNATCSLVFMVAVMWHLNDRLTLLALLTVPALLFTMRILGRNMRQRSLAAQQADSRLTALVQEGIAALPVILSFSQEHREEQRFQAQTAETYRQRLSQHGGELRYLAAIGVIFSLGLTGLVWLGAQEVWSGALSLGGLVIFVAYLGQFYEPLNQLSHVGITVSDALAGTQRIFEILDTPEEVRERPGARPVTRHWDGSPDTRPVRLPPAWLTPPRPKATGPALAPATLVVRGQIEFSEVYFGYQPEVSVLRNISFLLKEGESVAIVGPSGAGKSTLIHLLPRFFDPTSGAVLLDGVDVRDLRLRDLRAQVALVMQEPMLLPGTIAENIAYGKPEAKMAEIIAAAQAAHADGFIQKLSLKYDTVVGEGAGRLSTGEKQRLSLARAFLKEAPVLILDEPTSALDAEGESLIVASLQALMRGRTTLLVAHRLSTLRGVNKVLVLNQGRLAETGTPQELFQRPDSYLRRMAVASTGPMATGF